MAVIIPYADANAHGSIAGSVTFRRRFGKVIFQKKPNPKNSNTAGQIAQRQAFKDASTEWNFYDSLSKAYFRTRAPTLQLTARNLFMHAYMTNIMPSQVGIEIKQITALQILVTAGANPTSGGWVFYKHVTGGSTFLNRGNINDNQNILVPAGADTNPTDYAKIVGSVDVGIPFRYGFSVTYIDLSDVSHDLIVRLPEAPTGSADYFLSNDGSVYSDSALTHLLATNNF
jgi:hypothetical protein